MNYINYAIIWNQKLISKMPNQIKNSLINSNDYWINKTILKKKLVNH